MSATFADKIQMQNLLFAELSKMFGREVPLYDKSLLVNKACNQTVGALLARKYTGFQLSETELDKASGERHGAIRIGKPEEYRWVAAFFAALATSFSLASGSLLSRMGRSYTLRKYFSSPAGTVPGTG